MNSIASSSSKYFWFSRCPQSTVSRHLSKYFCRNMMNEGCIFIYKNLTASECIFLTFRHLMSNKISLLIYSLGHHSELIHKNRTKWFNLPSLLHTFYQKRGQMCCATLTILVDTCIFQFLIFSFYFKQDFCQYSWTFADKLVHVIHYWINSFPKYWRFLISI